MCQGTVRCWAAACTDAGCSICIHWQFLEPHIQPLTDIHIFKARTCNTMKISFKPDEPAHSRPAHWPGWLVVQLLPAQTKPVARASGEPESWVSARRDLTTVQFGSRAISNNQYSRSDFNLYTLNMLGSSGTPPRQIRCNEHHGCLPSGSSGCPSRSVAALLRTTP